MDGLKEKPLSQFPKFPNFPKALPLKGKQTLPNQAGLRVSNWCCTYPSWYSTTTATKILRSHINVPWLKCWFHSVVIRAETKTSLTLKTHSLWVGVESLRVSTGTLRLKSWGPKNLGLLLFRGRGGKQEDAHTLDKRFILSLFKN